MNNCPNPCDNCERDHKNKCNYRNCQPWKTRYLYKQKQINAYAKKVMPEYMASVAKKTAAADNRCVACGEIIPEGRMVCPICEKKG